jgi:hypothetical protein
MRSLLAIATLALASYAGAQTIPTTATVTVSCAVPAASSTSCTPVSCVPVQCTAAPPTACTPTVVSSGGSCTQATIVPATVGATTLHSEPLSTFQNSIGVNVHMEYTDGLYANVTQVLADLKQLGITHVRDGVNVAGYSASTYVPTAEQMMQAGIKFDLIASTQSPTCGNPPAATAACAEPLNMASIDAFATADPGGVDAVEGLNETNNQAGVTEAENQPMQTLLYSDVHADPKLAGVPVYDNTGLVQHNIATLKNFDYANIHPYPQGGAPPLATFAEGWSENYVGSTTGVITEFGYYTKQDGSNGVDELSQAAYLADGIWDAALAGDYRVYPYELLDAYSGNSYGLYSNNDYEPKLSAVWLANMHSVIPTDAVSAQRAVTVFEGTGSAALPSSVHQLALTASNGTIYVWTWDEQNIYNPKTLTSSPEGAKPFVISIPGYTASYFTPEAHAAVPLPTTYLVSAGTYAQSTYTNWPTCTIFTK